MANQIENEQDLIQAAHEAKESGEYVTVIEDGQNYVDFGLFACGYKVGGFQELTDDILPVWNPHELTDEECEKIDFESVVPEICEIFDVKEEEAVTVEDRFGLGDFDTTI